MGSIQNIMWRQTLALLPLLLLQVHAEYDLEKCMAMGGLRSKCITAGMNNIITDHIAWDDWEGWYEVMKDFWTEDMIYDSNWTPNGDFSNNTGLREFFDNEHIPFNLAFDNATFSKMIWVGEEYTSSYLWYAKSVWIGDLGTVPGSQHIGQEATIWDLDFYQIDEESGTKISYNWCLIDFVDLMRQLGYQVLPKPALREGFMLPPRAMDGIPAPITRLVNPEDSIISKTIIQALLEEDFVSGTRPSDLWDDKMVWYGVAGFGMATNKAEYEEHILAPIREGLSSRTLAIDVLNCEGAYCGAHGYLQAMHTGTWLGEEPTGLPINVRLAIHWRVDVRAEKVMECWFMSDLPAAFNMVGVNLFDRMTEQYRI